MCLNFLLCCLCVGDVVCVVCVLCYCVNVLCLCVIDCGIVVVL